MLAQSSLDGDEGGWRNNPKVAITAIVVALLAVLFFSCRSCRCRHVAIPTEQAEAVAAARWCLNCKKEFSISRSDIRKVPGDAPEAIKARQVPCPTCGKVASTEVLRCMHCGRFFSPVAGPDGKPPVGCPFCKQNPDKP